MDNSPSYPYKIIDKLEIKKTEQFSVLEKVSYKLYEGDVWVRYDFEDENSRVAFKDYVLEAGHDLGLKPTEAGLDFATFPTYGFLA